MLNTALSPGERVPEVRGRVRGYFLNVSRPDVSTPLRRAAWGAGECCAQLRGVANAQRCCGWPVRWSRALRTPEARPPGPASVNPHAGFNGWLVRSV
jgi:hypothetical protein